MNNFSFQPTTPTSKKYHDIGVSRIREMFVGGGCRTFAQFRKEVDYYERSKQQFLQQNNTYLNARVGLESSLNCFHGWLN